MVTSSTESAQRPFPDSDFDLEHLVSSLGIMSAVGDTVLPTAPADLISAAAAMGDIALAFPQLARYGSIEMHPGGRGYTADVARRLAIVEGIERYCASLA